MMNNSKKKKVTLAEKAKHLASDMTQVAKTAATTGKLRVDTATQTKRMNICWKCDKFDGSTCTLCGCVAKYKVVLAGVQCPMNKW